MKIILIKIEPNTLPENLTTLIFGYEFNQKIKPNSLPHNILTLVFGYKFNQIIDTEMLPDNLVNLTFRDTFNQQLDVKILPLNLTNITFEWMDKYIQKYKTHINMINNIPSYYNVILFSNNNLDINGSKWPIHVKYYTDSEWSSKVYDIIDKYVHSIYGEITVLINKKTYEPYSCAKSAIK